MTTEPEAIPAEYAETAYDIARDIPSRVRMENRPFIANVIARAIADAVTEDRASRAPVDGAEAKPVAWRWKVGPFRWAVVHGFDPSLNLDDEHLSSLQPLYTHPAPASPDAEMVRNEIEAAITKYAGAAKRNAFEMASMPLSVVEQHFREFSDEIGALLSKHEGPRS